MKRIRFLKKNKIPMVVYSIIQLVLGISLFAMTKNNQKVYMDPFFNQQLILSIVIIIIGVILLVYSFFFYKKA